MSRTKKKSGRLAVAAALLMLPIGASAQIFPLSENNWSNPEFVKRFTGSYGINSAIEPSLTREEGDLLNLIPPLVAANDTAGAITLLRSNLLPESSSALNFTLGSLLLQQGQSVEAIRQYEAAIKKFPNFMRAYKNTGLAHLSEGRFEEALPFLQKALELGDRDGSTFGLLGYAYLNLGRYALAADAYRIAQVTMPNNKDWAVGKASALMQAGNYHEAIPAFKQLILQDPNRPAYYTSLANAYVTNQQTDLAAVYLELLKRRGLADPNALMLLGDIYINQGIAELALNSYSAALDKGGLPPERALRFARALTQRAAYNEADTFISQVADSPKIQLSDEDRTALLNIRAQVAMATQRDEDAARILEDIVSRDPLNGEALVLLGRFNMDKQDFETAEYYFERAEKVRGTEAEALVEHARLKVAQQQYGEAVRLLERAQGIQPRSNVGDYLEAVRNAFEATR